jgi:hypothetical protein
MAAPDPTAARFPEAPAKAGMYESFYLKLCHPSEPLGAWIRYTVHKRPGAQPTGSLWFTLFDASTGPRAVKTTLPGPSAGGDWIRVGESHLGPERALGTASGEGREASWELRLDTPERPLFHLPRGWMYGGPLPRTKLLSPAPAARFDGRVAIDGHDVEVDGWRGMIGHNWGAQHAERWIWMHGLGFDGVGEATWIDAAIGRIKLGPLTTPWIANGALSLDGERIALGGPGRRVRIDERPDHCDFTIPGKGGGGARDRVRPARALRRLGLCRSRWERAPHGQLLHRRHGARRRARGLAADATVAGRRGGLRAGHARARPRHGDTAVS